MSKIQAYAAAAKDRPVAPHSIERRALRPDDVEIAIEWCGVCHTDIHIVENDWGRTKYPVVPGHEIVGRVTAVGRSVTQFKESDPVGVGCMVDSCQSCASCGEGLEQYCERGFTGTYNGVDRVDGSVTYGGYSRGVVVSERFVLNLPAALDAAAAAPLLCAGITTYSPLKHFGVEPGDEVGVVGMGGLGHMAVKFAKAMGARVTVFTRSADKAEECRAQGADDVLLSTSDEAMARAAGRFDLLLDTVPVAHPLDPYVATLKRDGTLVLLGMIEPVDPPVNAAALIFGRRRLAGSLIGGIAETQEMLDFCAEHNITCDIEIIRMDEINDAYARMKRGDVHYRFVIDMATLGA